MLARRIYEAKIKSKCFMSAAFKAYRRTRNINVMDIIDVVYNTLRNRVSYSN